MESLLPDPNKKSGKRENGYRVFYVKWKDPIQLGHWLNEEELGLKMSDFEDPVFILG